MADRPILFSAPMVRALLDGRKTQTRRVISKKAAHDALAVFGPNFLLLPGNVDLVGYAAGDRLWVREAFSVVCGGGASIGGDGEWSYIVEYRSGGQIELSYAGHYTNDPYVRLADSQIGDWRPSIHMPRWASRLTLIVTDVRVQRLQEISEEDAVAEGCEASGWYPTPQDPDNSGGYESVSATDAYATLWNSLHGPEAWDANPWVAAISFDVIRENIDKIAAD